MRKKIVALFAAAATLMASLGAVAAEMPRAILNESFNEFAFNEVPSEMAVDAVDARVVQRNGADKALTGKAWGGNDFALVFPLSEAQNKTVIEADIKIDNSLTDANVITVKVGKSTINLLRYGKDGRIYLSDGRIIGGYRLGEWKRFSIAVDFEAAALDLYVDGKQLYKKHRFSFTKYSAPTEIAYYCSAPEGETYSSMCVDNLLVYSGSVPLARGSFPSKGASTEVLEFIETTKMPETGKLYSYYDFESKGDLNFSYSGNSKVEISEESKDNKVLHINRAQGDKEVMCDFVFPAEMYNLKKFIVQFDIKVLHNSSVISMFEIVDHSGNLTSSVSLTNGTFYLNGVTVCSIAANSWYNIAISYDNVRKVYSAYVNGALMLADRALPYGEAWPLRGRIRAQDNSGANSSDFYINNLLAYSGNKLISFGEDKIQSIINPEPIGENADEAKELLGSMSAFLTDNDTMYIKGEKLYYGSIGAMPYKDGNGCFMVPESLIEKAFDAAVEISDGEISVNGQSVMTVGSVDIKGRTEKLEGEPVLSDGFLFLPLQSVCSDILGLYVSFDERGMYLIDDNPIEYTNSIIAIQLQEPIDIIYRYLQFDRPSGEKIYEAFKAHTPQGQHPRLITTPSDVEKIKQYIDTDEDFLSYLDTTLKSANAYLTREPVKQDYNSNGGTSFLGSARSIMTRIRCLGIAYTFTGDEIYAKGCWREMENVMDNWASWNGNTYFLLDTSETSYGIVMGFDFLYSWMTQEQKQKVIDTVFDKHLNYITNVYKGRHVRTDWVTSPANNWSFVCNGGVIAACMVFADEVSGERLAQVKFMLESAFKSLEVGMMSFYPDGAWAEGPGYWQYAVMYLFGAGLAPLKNGCGTTFDLMDTPGVSETLITTISTQGTTGTAFEYGDCATGYGEKDAIGFLIALVTEDEVTMKTWRSVLDNMGVTGDERTLLWYKPAQEGTEAREMALDRYFYSCDVGSMRASYSIREAAYLGVKAGLTDINSHANLDSGTFVFDMLGKRWANELGYEDYDIKSINYWTQHYLMYRCRPEGQNVVVINPKADMEDIGYFGGQLRKKYAPLVKQISKPRGAAMTFDLSEVYSVDTESYKRGFILGDDRQTITVQDEIKLREDNSEILWFMHTKADLDIAEDGKSIIMSLDGRRVKVEAVSNAQEWHFEERKVEPFPTSPQLPDQLKGAYEPVGMKKITLAAKASGNLNITVKFSPVLEYEEFEAPTYEPMENWSIEDGEIPEKIRATSISSDGTQIKGFEADKFNYTVGVPYGSALPVITATSNIGEVNVIQSDDLTVPAKVIVTGDNGKSVTYTISMKMVSKVIDDLIPGLVPEVGIAGGYKTMIPVSSSVSLIQEAVNDQTKLIDSDFSTRWAVEGYEQWAEVDLGAVYDISGIALGIYEGVKRQNIMQLQVSEDGLCYYTIYDGKTSGKTSNYESYMFPSVRKVRFIKYIGNQSTIGTWNSVTEIAAIVKE